MNVCILSHAESWGGSEVHTAELARVLADRGHCVTIVALGEDVYGSRLGRRPHAGVEVRKPPLSRPLRRMSFPECLSLLRRLRGDVGLMVRSGMEVGSLRLDLAARLRFARYITIEHTCAELDPPSSRRHFFGLVPGLGLWRHKARLLWHCRSSLSHRVVCVTESARAQMIRNFYLSRRKVVAVRNGIDVEQYRPDEARRAAVRRSWGVSEGTVVLGAVSRLSWEKGLDDAIALFGRLTARRPERDLRLVLAGDGPMRERLQAAVREAGLEGRVLFPGFTERPWEVHCGLDVYLQPSRTEAIGLALLEAMACERPPVATAVGGVPEALSEPGVGWLTPPGDSEAFLAALDEATGLDAGRRREIGRAARRHVVARFNAAVQYQALARVIENG